MERPCKLWARCIECASGVLYVLGRLVRHRCVNVCVSGRAGGRVGREVGCGWAGQLATCASVNTRNASAESFLPVVYTSGFDTARAQHSQNDARARHMDAARPLAPSPSGEAREALRLAFFDVTSQLGAQRHDWIVLSTRLHIQDRIQPVLKERVESGAVAKPAVRHYDPVCAHGAILHRLLIAFEDDFIPVL